MSASWVWSHKEEKSSGVRKKTNTGLDSEIVFRQTATISILRWVVKKNNRHSVKTVCCDLFTAVTFQGNTLRWRITRRTTAASTLSCWFKTLTFLYWLCLVTVKYHTNHHWEHQQPVGIVGPVGKLTSAARGSTTVFVREGRPEEIKASGGYLCLLWCE